MANSPEKTTSPTPPADSAPKILRFLVRMWGVIAALCTISTGLFVLITITSKCLVAGIIQIVFGGLVLCFEAPVLFSFSPTLVKISDWVESHFRFWIRASFYLLGGVPPIVLCVEMSTIIGSGSVVVLAALYGVLAIGKKGGDAQTQKQSDDVEMKTQLMKDGEANEDGGF